MTPEETNTMPPDGVAHIVVPRLGNFIEGAVTLEDGMILIYDLERFLRENDEFLFDREAKTGAPT